MDEYPDFSIGRSSAFHDGAAHHLAGFGRRVRRNLDGRNAQRDGSSEVIGAIEPGAGTGTNKALGI
jgi:hypothetical protein